MTNPAPRAEPQSVDPERNSPERDLLSLFEKAAKKAADQIANQNGGGGGGAGGFYDIAAKLKLVHNERIKLTATMINNVAVGFCIVGIVTPVVRFVSDLDRPAGVFTVGLCVGWLLTAVVLHLEARAVLRSLEP